MYFHFERYIFCLVLLLIDPNYISTRDKMIWSGPNTFRQGQKAFHNWLFLNTFQKSFVSAKHFWTSKIYFYKILLYFKKFIQILSKFYQIEINKLDMDAPLINRVLTESVSEVVAQWRPLWLEPLQIPWFQLVGLGKGCQGVTSKQMMPMI